MSRLSKLFTAGVIAVFLLSAGAFFWPERKRGTPSSQEERVSPREITAIPVPDDLSLRANNRRTNKLDYTRRPAADTAVEVISSYRSKFERRPKYFLIGRDGRITEGAIKAGSLTDAEAAGVQQAFDQLQEQVRELMGSKTTQLPELLNESTIKAYRIGSFKEEGESKFSSFLDSMSNTLGPQRAWELAKSIPVDMYAGKFGSYEVTVSVTKPSDKVLNSNRITPEEKVSLQGIKIEYRNPSTNELIQTSNSFMAHDQYTIFNYDP